MVDDNQVMEEATQEVVEQPEQEQEQIQEETPQAKNFKALREKAEKMQRERDEAYRLIKEYEAQTAAKAQSAESTVDDTDFNLGPDDLAEGKHLSKVAKKIKSLEDQLKNYQQQSYTATAESRLKSKYSDFEEVVNPDNIAQLRDAYPSIASSIGNNKDMYSAGESAYLFIKKLGIVPDNSYDNDKVLAQRNSTKPRPLVSVSPQQGNSPLSRANAFENGLTEDLRKQLHKEMIDAMKNR